MRILATVALAAGSDDEAASVGSPCASALREITDMATTRTANRTMRSTSARPDICGTKCCIPPLGEPELSRPIHLLSDCFEISNFGEWRTIAGVPESESNLRGSRRLPRKLWMSFKIHLYDVTDDAEIRASRELLITGAAVPPAIAASLIAVAESIRVYAICNSLRTFCNQRYRVVSAFDRRKYHVQSIRIFVIQVFFENREAGRFDDCLTSMSFLRLKVRFRQRTNMRLLAASRPRPM